MAYGITPASTYQLWRRLAPNREAVTFFSRTAADNFVSYALFMDRVEANVDEVNVGIVILASGGAQWRGWKYDFDVAGAPYPKVDDYFIDALSPGYSIIKVTQTLLGNVFNFECNSRS